MTPQQPAANPTEDATTDDADLAAKDTLAALLDLPLIDFDAAHDLIRTDPDRYRMDTLPLLPDDGIGVGDATLYRFPANLYGEPATRHRTTWVVSVAYDYDGPDDYDLAPYATEEGARQHHAQRIAARLADGCPDPNEEVTD